MAAPATCTCGGDRACLRKETTMPKPATRYRWTLSYAVNNSHAIRRQAFTTEVTGPATPAGAMTKLLHRLPTNIRQTIRYVEINRKETLT